MCALIFFPYLKLKEIERIKGMVMYEDESVIVLNKPPKFPVRGKDSRSENCFHMVVSILTLDLKIS